MRKIFWSILISGSFLFLTTSVKATDVAGSSANMQYLTQANKDVDAVAKVYRTKLVLRKVLEKYHSPLVDNIDGFVAICQKYDLDCYLLPAITGLESSFGLYIYPNSYNPFGWGGGYMMFKNWDEGIDAVGNGLRENYINRGADNLYAIGRIYSESPTWAVRVERFMNEFKAEEAKLPLFLSENKVEL